MLGAAVAANSGDWYRKLLASRQWRDWLKTELRANAPTGVSLEEAALKDAVDALFFEVMLEPNLLARQQLGRALLRAPRTDPYVRVSRIRLLPRM